MSDIRTYLTGGRMSEMTLQKPELCFIYKGAPGTFRPQFGKTHWPTILSVCMAVFCTLIIAIILIKSRILGRIWIGCPGPHACSDESISSKTTQQTSIA